jgi:hypothetical protein
MDDDTGLSHAKVKTDRSGDPLGKRALFSVPPAGEGDTSAADKRSESSGAGPDGVGDPMSGDGPRPAWSWFTVRCQRCHQVSRVSLIDLLIFQFPIGVWIPRGAFDRRMTCPSCRKRSWCSVTLRRD